MSGWRFVDVTDSTFICDVPKCERLARWVLVGESGELFMCDDHHAKAITE